MLAEPANISHKDVLDAIISACQKEYDVPQPDGSTKREMGLDSDAMWWKTNQVPAPTFGEFAKLYKRLWAKAEQCKFHMMPERAIVMESQIKDMCGPFKTSIDAKSSESRLNKLNRNKTLLDTLSHNKAERVVSITEEGKRSLKEAILGKEKDPAE